MPCDHAVLRCAALCLVPCHPVAVLSSDDVNIVAVLKAMGAESDQEVVQLVGPDEQLAALLMPSIQVCVCAGGDALQGLVLAHALLLAVHGLQKSKPSGWSRHLA